MAAVRKLVLLASVAAAGVGAAGGAGILAEREVARSLADAGLAVADVDASVTGRLSLSGLRASLGESGSLGVARMSVPGQGFLASAALAAEDVTLEGVTVELGPLAYRLPRIEVKGSSLGRSDLQALLDRNATEPLAARLMKFSAGEIVIPEVTIEQKLGKEMQTTTYRDLRIRDVAAGKIASATAAGATMRASGDDDKAFDATFGAMTVNDFDAVLAARLYTEKAGPDDREPRLLYASFSGGEVVMKNKKGVEMRIGRIAGSDFKVRPTREPLLELIKSVGASGDFEKMPPAERGRLVGLVIDLCEAFDAGSMEITDLTVSDPTDRNNAAGRIRRIALGGAAGSAQVTVEGIEMVSKEGNVKLGTLSVTGFSLKPTLDGLKELIAKPEDKVEEADFRKLVPVLGTMRFTDVDVDMPDSGKEARDTGKAGKNGKGSKEANGKGLAKKEPDRLRMTIRAVELQAGKPINGIPTSIRTAVERAAFAIPDNTKEDGLRDLADLGYKTLDVSFAVDGAWDEPTQEFAIKEVSFAGTDMGQVVLRGVLGNITKDVFSTDMATAQVALIGATAKNLKLTVENQGLFERLLQREAKKQKKKPEDLRKEYGVTAAIGIPALLGASEPAKVLANAVARFVARPGRLEINARTKDGAGLGFADFIAAGGEASALADKIDLTATAD
ncbi:hypothetical protein QNA08_02675 [Chelatococcus sp. SYSU_G07232]|uniref:AsmA-like C-terminal domain-containing protein n=1 Tax=Chelatococcus albus TaxID=3047466 RepID=A0ABT7ACP3_9HYPH|nr:hypothetical protein [Chelatococcus sp. SYSU_G07232]MDJ1157142.1 hypothetical protein [Chelatococcus sp. SYSU_G07232]